MNQQRHLAAILFTDIVGYTAMMQQNELQAVATIKRYLSVLKLNLEACNGELVNDYGDGSLCVFSSAVDAVNCAKQIQHNLQQTPAVPLRIGLHIGEIFFEDGKVLGDGVNVASRVQSLAVGNSILLSKDVNNKIKNRTEFKTVSLGSFEFKNVDEPVEVFALCDEGLIIPKREQMEGKLKKSNASKNRVKKYFLPLSIIIAALIAVFFYNKFYVDKSFSNSIKSIAILPFKNESVTKENESFCNGVMEAVLNNLSQVQQLRVISRQSVEQYRSSNKTMPEIAKELDVGFILEGSVQRFGNQIKVSAQLINANADQEIWSQEFPGTLDDYFTLQENIAEQISNELKVKITPEEKNRIGNVTTTNPQALDAYYDAQMIFVKYAGTLYPNDSDYNKIQFLCNNALSLDSNMSDVYVLKAKAYFIEFSDLNKSSAKTKNFTDTLGYLCNKAYALNNNSADALQMQALYYFAIGDHNKELSFLEKALAINPNHFDALVELIDYYLNIGSDDEKAIMYSKKALALNPQSIKTPALYRGLAAAYMDICDFNNAKYYLQKELNQDINPTAKSNALWFLGHFYMVVGNGDSVIKFATENLQNDSNALYQIAEAYCRLKNNCTKAIEVYQHEWRIFPEHLNLHRYAITLIKSGKKEEGMRLMDSALVQYKRMVSLGRFQNNTYDLAGIYAALGDKDNAYKILRTPPENNLVWGLGFPYLIQTDALFDNLRNDKEFKDLVQNAINAKTIERERIKKLEASGQL